MCNVDFQERSSDPIQKKSQPNIGDPLFSFVEKNI